MILVPPFEPEVRMPTRGTVCANFGFGALALVLADVGGMFCAHNGGSGAARQW